MSSIDPNLKDVLKRELYTRYQLEPTNEWLTSFLSTINRPPPLPALVSTAHFRLTATDFTTSLVARPPYLFPAGLGDVQVKSTTLQNCIPVQVLDVSDIGASRWSQIEAMERIERGEEIKGREVIRNVPVSDGEMMENEEAQRPSHGGRQTGNSHTIARGVNKGSNGPHKLLLQDSAGTKAWAFEVGRIDKITIISAGPRMPGAATQAPVEGIQIGCKLLLKSGTNTRRGLIMLTPANTTVMGGKVEAWDKKWRESRKNRLQQEVDLENTS